MQSDVTVLAAGEQSLSELAAEANREHELTEFAVRSALVHALNAGSALLEARARVPVGAWRDWLNENFDASLGLAEKYMRVANHRALIESHLDELGTLNSALVYLRGLRVERGRIALGHTDETRAEAARLFAGGMRKADISRVLGVSKTTITVWLDPTAEARALASRQRWGQRKRETELAAKEARIRRAVRKKGGAIAELYSMAERLQDVIAQAQQETEDLEARRRLSEAGAHYRQMRDEIVRALGVS